MNISPALLFMQYFALAALRQLSLLFFLASRRLAQTSATNPRLAFPHFLSFAPRYVCPDKYHRIAHSIIYITVCAKKSATSKGGRGVDGGGI